MVVLIVNGSAQSYVTGVFSSRSEAAVYLEEVPTPLREQLVVKAHPELELPCFLIEDRAGIRAAGETELERTLRAWSAEPIRDDEPVGNVYWIAAAWRPPKAGTDYMGVLKHAHVERDGLDRFARGGLEAFLSAWLTPTRSQ